MIAPVASAIGDPLELTDAGLVLANRRIELRGMSLYWVFAIACADALPMLSARSPAWRRDRGLAGAPALADLLGAEICDRALAEPGRRGHGQRHHDRGREDQAWPRSESRLSPAEAATLNELKTLDAP